MAKPDEVLICAPHERLSFKVADSLHLSQAQVREAFLTEAMHSWSHGFKGASNTTRPSQAKPEHESHHQNHSANSRRVEANNYILDMCSGHVNQKLGAPPAWIQPDYRDPPPNLQCASTASNIYRLALKESHCIRADDNKSYRWLDQVSVQKFMHVMEDSGLAKRIPRSQIRPGDCVIGESDLNREAGNTYRHVGFIGHEIKGRGHHDMVAYSNAGGTFRKQELNDRFGHYKHEYFLRLYLPKFQHKDA